MDFLSDTHSAKALESTVKVSKHKTENKNVIKFQFSVQTVCRFFIGVGNVGVGECVSVYLSVCLSVSPRSEEEGREELAV